ncbi:MlaD family protein [Snuella sedimenti]|uniref:MCE family protein n=1 Tax=Snuella sedimenti TaxID=2798802 RepID=A0A8J7LP58_9FLAO|nr:MlaD family protein [Snuella sedimenti]MBJ6368863.1 MCE family protein [Snuella sedimenti]
MKISKEVKTGVLVLSGILLFIFGFNYLKGQNLLGTTRTYLVVYDNVEGLTSSAPVTINGLTVGKITEINFKGDGSGKLQVKLLIDSDFQFSKNSKAELYETGLIGGKAIAIVPAFDGAEEAQNGSYLDGTMKAGLTELVNQRLTPLQEKIERVMASTDVLLANLNDVFDEETKGNLKTGIAGLSEVITNFKATSKSIDRLVVSSEDKLKNTLSNVDSISGNLSKVTEALADADLKQITNNLETTLKSFDVILAGLEKGEGSMGKLLKDDALYNNLTGASKEMEALLEDIKLHPKRYFRILSKKEIPYTAPQTN